MSSNNKNNNVRDSDDKMLKLSNNYDIRKYTFDEFPLINNDDNDDFNDIVADNIADNNDLDLPNVQPVQQQHNNDINQNNNCNNNNICNNMNSTCSNVGSAMRCIIFNAFCGIFLLLSVAIANVYERLSGRRVNKARLHVFDGEFFLKLLELYQKFSCGSGERGGMASLLKP
ncbi:hypothetical protein HELRODRAFT_159352 [Helobdella robusta]|uniref:Uncharacterized protein n=1 Tax=Helobdella robusta TaxID=6412 RepID=T1ENX4_HELRO|nr:hypothetical protein HELRODRAFT_159352 [Helobdella robusta]ESO12769.1 hypothetical protein HELRODRAFT_159352 [Helobdella robusta]